MIFVLQQNPISTGSTCAYNELPPIDRDPTIKVSIYLQRSCVHTYRYWELINQKSLKINKQVEKETGPRINLYVKHIKCQPKRVDSSCFLAQKE